MGYPALLQVTATNFLMYYCTYFQSIMGYSPLEAEVASPRKYWPGLGRITAILMEPAPAARMTSGPDSELKPAAPALSSSESSNESWEEQSRDSHCDPLCKKIRNQVCTGHVITRVSVLEPARNSCSIMYILYLNR